MHQIATQYSAILPFLDSAMQINQLSPLETVALAIIIAGIRSKSF